MIRNLGKISGIISAPVPIMLVLSGLFFSFYLKFFFIRHPKKMLAGMLSSEKREGVSPFSAVTLALSGTLGVGNIVGVFGAITLGGFGAVFWMWVSALCAMVLKYAEIVLAVSHRRKKGNERFGGAPYYIRDLFEGRGDFGLAKRLSFIFAAVCLAEVLSTGCGIQINAAADALFITTGIPPIVTGILTALLTLYAVFGGAKRVAGITVKLIPALSITYILLSLAVIFLRLEELPRVFCLIFENAFAPAPAAGGVLGFVFCRAVRYGSMRGLLSNEAGCGTAPLAHAASNTESAPEQGFWGIFEVFFDTVVLCTLTAAVIIISYDTVALFAQDPIKAASRAFSCVLGDFSGCVMGFCVAGFGISTVACCAHYAKECIFYVLGTRSKAMLILSLCIYCAAAVWGAVAPSELLWHVSDISLSLMTAINISVLILMRKEIRRLTESYFYKN